MTKTVTSLLLMASAIFPCLSYSQTVDHAVELYRGAKYSQAESELRKVVEQKGDDARANEYLGLALLDQNKANDAEPYLKKAESLDSTGETKAGLARLYAEQKDYSKAEAALDGADGEQAQYAKGLVMLNQKRYDESAKAFESFLQSNPDHPYAHYYAGMAYNGLKRPDKMLTHFELFVRLKPDAPEARKVNSVLRSVR